MKESEKRMDTKKLNRITWKRAKPIVLSLGILLILISVFIGFNSTTNWHRRQNFIHSQEARDHYNSYLAAQKTEEDDVNKKYKETKDYQGSVDYAENQNAGIFLKFDSKTGKFHIQSQTFKEFYGYIRTKLFYTRGALDLTNFSYLFTSRNVFRGFTLISLFFIVAGFLVSFLNYKTDFLQILFSSGYKRKQILKSSILTSLIPLILMAITAVSINLVILYSRIPHQYINYPLDKIIFYQFCILLVAICYYFLGFFSGTILGQGITGALSLIGFVFGLELIKQNILDILNNVFNNILNNKNDGIYYQSFFVRFDTYSHWLILDGFVILTTFLFYFSAQYFYQRLSLEERGNYLLFPKFRFPISLVAGLFTAYSICGNIGLGSSSINLLIRYNILPGILVFVITFCFFMVLNNYKKIYEKIGMIILKPNNQLSKK